MGRDGEDGTERREINVGRERITNVGFERKEINEMVEKEEKDEKEMKEEYGKDEV